MDSASLGKKYVLVFDDSGLEASLNFLRNKSDQNLEKLVSAPGNKLAYAHYLWSSPDSQATIEEFWATQLSNLSWSPKLEQNVNNVKSHLLMQEETKWLKEVLRYLPRGHSFNTTVYLNLSYDNIVFDENVALNLNFRQFNMDRRESVYYLIHELAHAGYVRYHPLPQLGNIRTNGELSKIVKFLTHLEGMGILSALRLRMSEGGLLDNDYKVLLNDAERARRIDEYFRLFDKFKGDLNKKVDEPPTRVFDKMSGKETRLWYITGCHMAREIEKRHGVEALRNLVKQGSEAFFTTYSETADH
ncbi:MAG TPA: DUF5700 domain-containing putative Zn-dependent protease [Candidatus Bathyarchaeia archaeon]|nr:DUF5700 domain-containing putative Zn-dependent protease [Candidatus Bathyarchaeia archaeon]